MKIDMSKTDVRSEFIDFLMNASSYVLSKEEVEAEREKGEQHLQRGDRWMRVSDFESKCSALGYLTHTYKNPACCPVVVAIDAKTDSDETRVDGGTGKSLAMFQAPSHVVNTIPIDGMSFDPSERFAFQQVELSTELIAIDDAQRNFKFNSLFQRITGDFIVERKNQPKFSIPFSKSPKFVITTNFPLKGDGNSYDRRQFIVEFSDFYLHNKTTDVHKKVFFTEWKWEDWNAFHLFMIGCMQLFLGRGLIKPIIRSYEERKFTASMPDDFAEWANSAIVPDQEYQRNDLIEKYKLSSGNEKISARKFSDSIKKWTEHNGYILNPQKNGGRDIRNGVVFLKVCKKGDGDTASLPALGVLEGVI